MEKATQPDFPRHIIGFTVPGPIELEAKGLTDAAAGARRPERLNRRNS
jgi:hypothetical protein